MTNLEIACSISVSACADISDKEPFVRTQVSVLLFPLTDVGAAV